MAWTMIEQTVLTSSQASVTLGSGGTIPQTYKTLKLLISARDDHAGQVYGNIKVTVNGSSTTYSGRLLQGNGASASSSTNATTEIETLGTGASATASTFGNTEITFPNYTSTTVNKPVSVDNVTETNGTTAYQRLNAVLWSTTSAITSITINPTSGSNNLQSGSTFTLYGLA